MDACSCRYALSSSRWRNIILAYAPLLVGTVAHNKLKSATRKDILVREVGLRVGLAVERSRLYIFVVGRVVLRHYGEGSAILEVD